MLYKSTNFKMIIKNITKILLLSSITLILLNSCNGKLPGGDARKNPADPKERVKRNLEEGRGFKIMDLAENRQKGGVFDFASSNELWRASLDVIDFMPLSSVNYSGGIIITDWYSNDQNSNENVKISIRFLTNEIRSDALDIKVFKKICKENNNCKISESSGEIIKELKKKILMTAKIYETQKKDKNFKPYKNTKLKGD